MLAQAVARDPERLWIENVRVDGEAPDMELPPASEEAQRALADLAGLSLMAQEDPDFVRLLHADWLALLDKLPLEVAQASADLLAIKQDPLAQVQERLRQAIPILMGRVAQRASASS